MSIIRIGTFCLFLGDGVCGPPWTPNASTSHVEHGSSYMQGGRTILHLAIFILPVPSRRGWNVFQKSRVLGGPPTLQTLGGLGTAQVGIVLNLDSSCFLPLQCYASFLLFITLPVQIWKGKELACVVLMGIDISSQFSLSSTDLHSHSLRTGKGQKLCPLPQWDPKYMFLKKVLQKWGYVLLKWVCSHIIRHVHMR